VPGFGRAKREDSLDWTLEPPRLEIVVDSDLKIAVLMADTSLIMIIFRSITIYLRHRHLPEVASLMLNHRQIYLTTKSRRVEEVRYPTYQTGASCTYLL
jgi:hypothetical protein